MSTSFQTEEGTATFTNANSVTVTFSSSHDSPVVVATVASDIGINVFVDSVSSTSAVIRTSDIFTGDIHYRIISAS